ncbi:hypothetical protein PPTG_15987 [Phytophthora nicotianae INRA-310]|uniref:Uncharacterized protein n=1 Tax=Phytophthora nicotianae (strain INRA-310) TaxID=761204 RepID=W2PUV7_PHYN3|nr:hypothetical protein PPTG_15987 [Phytophthora nicotianae INRA-310]ETN03795.1 hypothetical protein PPTG_15987 [Phytophthora nicotianae INRA-310]
MDTVRSEYSEGSLASSRLDDGSTTGRGSFSFSLSTSRVSIDSASTRSDYLSSYERKFQERKAAKHKKSEKAKREKEKADRQDLFSADVRRKAQREAERQARRKEMESWLTDPKELKRIERRSQKRSRDRMRTLKEWYIPATLGPHEEVQPVFAAAMQQSNQEHSSRKKVTKPILTKEAAAVKDEEDREAMGVMLHRQLNAFTSKLEYLEQLTDPVTPPIRVKTRARRRRVVKENLHLAPLGPARSNLQAVKSVANLPTYFTSQGERKLTTSTSLQILRPSQVDNEDDEDAIDDAEVEQYLLRHRRISRQNYAAVKLQATWRMYLRRRKYIPWRQRRTRHRRAIFEIWVMTYRVGYRAQRSLLRKYFTVWHLDVIEALQLREMELHLFRQAATQTELPRMVLNLVFTSDWEDERAKRLATKAEEAAKKKSIAPTSKAAFLNAFLSAAFGDVESGSENRSRVHQLRAQHVAAREEVRKKIVQHVFRLWKRVHEGNKRVGLNAQLCLKRAVRMAFGTRQRWPAEILLSVFEIWARWASFNRCKRLGLPLPQFTQSNPHWDIWLHNYQERQVRCVKAAAKAPGARLRRYFLRLHAFARRTIRERQVLALAFDHYSRVLRLKVLLEWREAIADSAAEKKLERGILLRMHRYACAKRKLRPLKESLRKKRQGWLISRSIRGWKRVQLHTCFKRELNLSKIENSPAWRSRLHRILDIWRDERDSLLLWRTFEAWTHFIRKRKLFITLRILCARQERRNLLFGVFNAWKAAKWERVDGFLEDNLRLDAWDIYRELSVFFPMLFYGSFSDAGSIFGGLPSSMYGDSQRLDKNDLLLATSGDAVRHFHGILVRESVMDVRNAILQTRHLVNAVDDTSGNTALHVAAQIEEAERRLEIVSLLLSEGATTLKRVNRHGLSPVQLASDPETQFLLNHGIYAFHSRNVLKTSEDCGNNNRLLVCMTSLMAREWIAGLRNPGDVRTSQWHSAIREELWLRQPHIRFASDSIFAAAVTRSRGFLNALKTRLCVSYKDFLDTGLSQTLVAYEDRYREWEERGRVRKIRAAEAGEYEAYARYLLATTLDSEACEQELIPSFAGLFFSLEFSIDEILSQAYRLEDECTAAEGELWELFQRIKRAEKAWSAIYSQEEATNRSGNVGILRIFSGDADADLFFKKEIFQLEFEQFNSSQRNENEDGMDSQQEALALDLESLMIRTKRKLRKVEKKLKRVQDQIDENERTHREALFTPTRRVEEICVARKALEQSRLRMASTIIKHSEAEAAVANLEHAKKVLKSGERSELLEVYPFANKLPLSVAELPLEDKKAFLEKEKARVASLFHMRVILEEVHATKPESGNLEIKPLPEPLHALQKEAVRKLHSLFVLNLLRSCCCWLAENMLAMETPNEEENAVESESDSESDTFVADETDTIPARKLSRLFSTAGSILAEGPPRRRSSIHNTRRVFETYQQGSSRNLEDPDSENMPATYAASAMLLFEEERRAAEAIERERLSAKKVEVMAAISEHNPVTGDLELPPDHIVSFDGIPVITRPESVAIEKKEVRRNRKKEELLRAMRYRQLQRKAESDSDSEENNISTQAPLLPVIHGDSCFGNFVFGDVRINHEIFHDEAKAKEEINAAATEAIWKRGGIKQVDSSTPSIKEVLAHTHRQNSTREKLRSGSRRQGVTRQASTELPQPLQDVPEVQAASVPDAKVSDNLSPVDQEQKAEQHVQGAASVFHLQPDTETISSSPEPIQNISQEYQVTACPDEEKIPAEVSLPEIQTNVHNRQNSASSVRTSRNCDEEVSNSVLVGVESWDEKQQHTEEYNDGKEIPSTMEIIGGGSHDKAPVNHPKLEEIVEADLQLQSPVVEISTSRTSDSRPKGSGFSRTRESDPLESDTHASACIKWEDSTALGVFPLAVVQPTLFGIEDRFNSFGQERGSTLSQVNCHRVAQPLSRTGEAEKVTGNRFVLGNNVADDLEAIAEVRAENFALRGKSLKMTKKGKRDRLKTSDSGMFNAAEKAQQHPNGKPKVWMSAETEAFDQNTFDGASVERPTTSISVRVVTKPVIREEILPEPIEIASDTSTPEFLPPKPFIRLDDRETEQDTNTSALLQLEGLGLSSADKRFNSSMSLTKLASGSPTKLMETTRSSRLAIHRKRHKVPEALEHDDLTLQGARMTLPKADMEESLELSGFEGMAPLSKAERERLWQEFASDPRSTNVREAYSILYPQMYMPASDAVPVNRERPSVSVEPSNLSLRVDSIRKPIQKALDQNRKFWSAVEGYRAIGSSPLVPLDAATITQRRQDKAQAIFDQFFRSHREKGSKREARGLSLPWLEMYPKEMAEVQRQLENAPKGLFDELQQIAELQISATLAKRQTHEGPHEKKPHMYYLKKDK